MSAPHRTILFAVAILAGAAGAARAAEGQGAAPSTEIRKEGSGLTTSVGAGGLTGTGAVKDGAAPATARRGPTARNRPPRRRRERRAGPAGRSTRSGAERDRVGLDVGVDQGIVRDLDPVGQVVGHEQQRLLGLGAVRHRLGHRERAEIDRLAASGQGLVASLVGSPVAASWASTRNFAGSLAMRGPISPTGSSGRAWPHPRAAGSPRPEPARCGSGTAALAGRVHEDEGVDAVIGLAGEARRGLGGRSRRGGGRVGGREALQRGRVGRVRPRSR